MFKSPPPYLARDGLVDLRKKILQTNLKYEKSLYSKHYFESSLITVVGLENNYCQDYIADEIPDDCIVMLCSTKYENTKYSQINKLLIEQLTILRLPFILWRWSKNAKC